MKDTTQMFEAMIEAQRDALLQLAEAIAHADADIGREAKRKISVAMNSGSGDRIRYKVRMSLKHDLSRAIENGMRENRRRH